MQTDFSLTSGTPQSGIWQATQSFPQFTEAGTWSMTQLAVSDVAGNQHSFSKNELQGLGFVTDFTVVSSISDTTPPQLTGLSFAPSVIDTSRMPANVTVRLTTSDDLAGVSFQPDNQHVVSLTLTFRSQSGGQTQSIASSSFNLVAGTPLNGIWQSTLSFPQFSEAGTWKISAVGLHDLPNNSVSLTTANLASMGLPTDLIVFQPSSVSDGAVGTSGGTIMDTVFASRASVTFPSGALASTTTVAIDVLSTPLDLPTPVGFSPGSFFINVALTPTPVMPFASPGVTLVLPLATFKSPGTPISLYRIDPASGLLVPAPKVGGGVVNGIVNADGLSASFAGVAHLSTLVGFFPSGVLGDVDGDGGVDCSDLAIVKASFGKRLNQVGFDARADLNRNGIVDINDLTLVSRQLPAGSVCK